MLCNDFREELNAVTTPLYSSRPKLEQADVDKIITACIAKMGEVAYANAYDEGRKWTLDEAVLYALKG